MCTLYMPICYNCQCYTNEHIYPQWKPQGTTWCSPCLALHKQNINRSLCHNCQCYTDDHIYPQWKPQGTMWCLPCFNNQLHHVVNPLPEGITSTEEDVSSSTD